MINYRQRLHLMDNEELASEFSDKIGNECGDFDWMMFHKGRKAVIDYLGDAHDYRTFCQHSK